MSITTKTGDSGETSLFSGERVAKNHPRLEFIGTLDEADSMLGLARAMSEDQYLKDNLLEIQRLLHTISSIVADCGGRIKVDPGELLHTVESMEEDFSQRITMPDSFIFPGDTKVGASIDMARAIVRRGERILVGMEKNKRDEATLPVVNRLSDLLWLLARYADQI